MLRKLSDFQGEGTYFFINSYAYTVCRDKSCVNVV